MKKTAYQKYKDSGVEWLGKIPKHWEILRLKRVTRFGYGDSLSEQDREHGDISVYGSNGSVGLHNCSNTKKPCLIIGRKGSFGKVVYSDKLCFAIDTTYYVDSTQTTQDIKWLYYCLQYLKLDAISKDSAIPGLAREDAYNKFLPFCDSEEQKAIADFLNKETARIDSLVQKKEQQIELLKEKRSVLITQSVTKGLNPNVKMKDSGVEWLGKIPKHWETLPIRSLAKKGYRCFIDGDWIETPYICTEGIRLIQTGNIGIGEYKEQGFRYIDKQTFYKLRCTEVKYNDILICRLAEPVGRACLAPNLKCKMITSVDVCILKLATRFESKFIVYALSNQDYLSWVTSVCRGSTRDRISRSMLGSMKIQVPPLSEQKAIADFLDKETTRIDSLIEKIKKSIALLKEYRSSLITSAVTGQIDVRESQAQEITDQDQKTEKQKLTGSLKVLDSRFRGNDRRVGGDKIATTIALDRDSIPKPQRDSRFRGNDKLIFKKTALGAEIVSQMKNDPHFGRTKFMKTLYLCEAHLQIPLKGEYKRSAAGPLDSSIYKIEGIMKKSKWFEVVKTSSMYKYKPLKNHNGHRQYFDKYYGGYKKELNRLLSLLKRFTTEQSEIVDTIYAVWNDFLLKGKKPSDSKIIHEVKNNWHKSKKRFSEDRLQKAIQWMKQQKLVPKGYGPKTIPDKGK